jgi:D-alanyl-D-alanine-carboxypeptidase/D-alanyl-D-alanine-endopeptidase
MYAAGMAPAMVVAVVRGDETYLDGFGETAPGSGIVPDSRSLVRIASLSKLFTSDVLAAMAAEGQVGLDDTLQALAPAGRVVPLAKGAQPITLLNLATHTGGLPREAPEPRWDWLAKVRLKPAGISASYSNIGFDLLADALGVAGNAPYPDLLWHYTTGPLAMHDTTPSPDAEQCSRMIVGGIPERPCEDQTVMAGNGGLYSTAADMAAWMRFQMDSTAPGAGRRAIAHRIYVDRSALKEVEGLDHAGPAAGIGLAWILLDPGDGTQPLLEKTGNIGGFMSYIAMAPGAQAGVFVSMARAPNPGPAMRAAIKAVNRLTAELAAHDTDTAAPPMRRSADAGPAQ